MWTKFVWGKFRTHPIVIQGIPYLYLSSYLSTGKKKKQATHLIQNEGGGYIDLLVPLLLANLKFNIQHSAATFTTFTTCSGLVWTLWIWDSDNGIMDGTVSTQKRGMGVERSRG